MVEDTSQGVTPVKSEAAGGGGLKGQTLLAKHRARQLGERCNLQLVCHAVPRQLDCRATNPLIVALHLAAEDAIDIGGGTTKYISAVCSVTK